MNHSFPVMISYNYPLFAALIAWAVAQISKMLIILITQKKLQFDRLIGSGGMPSAHSATVCSLAIAISKILGIGSVEFAISIILAAIVMYDAMGVRRSSGEQAKVLNKIVEILDIPELKQKEIKRKLKMYSKDSETFEDDEEDDEEISQLKEKLGHTPLEVLGGALLGILIAIIIPIHF